MKRKLHFFSWTPLSLMDYKINTGISSDNILMLYSNLIIIFLKDIDFFTSNLASCKTSRISPNKHVLDIYVVF